MKKSGWVPLGLSLIFGLLVMPARATDSPVCNAGTTLCDQGQAFLNALREADAYACYTTTGQLAQQNTHNSQAVLLAPLDPNRYQAKAECYREFDHLYSVYNLYTSYFPPGATCAARPAINVPVGSGAVCHEGCSYAAPPGQSTATATGGTCVAPETTLDPGKNCLDCLTTGKVAVGDPVNMFTGIEHETVEDFRSNGHLSFSRYYSSSLELPQMPGLGGPWRHSYMRFIQTVDASTVRVVHANGSNYLFRKTASGWKTDWDVSERLIATVSNEVVTAWTLIANDDSRESYDADGRLTGISYKDGEILTLSHSNGQLQSVRDRQGRELVFGYQGSNLVSVGFPHGRAVQYGYDGTGRLTSVAYQNGNLQDDLIQYRYDDVRFPQALTARLDELGNVEASWEYDDQGRVIRSVHGDAASSVDQTLIAYGANGSTVTNSLGETSFHGFTVQLGRAKLVGSNKACAGCGGSGLQSQTYDRSGYPDISIDMAGAMTDADYSPAGLLFRKVEAANDATGKKRTTETFWNPDFRVPSRRDIYDAAGVLIRRETWSYNGRGQVLSHSVTSP